MRKSVVLAVVLVGVCLVMMGAVSVATSSINSTYDTKINITLGKNWTNLELQDSTILTFVNFEADLENTKITNIHDLSSKNDYGTSFGDVYINSTNCLFGKCAKFDGVGDYIHSQTPIDVSSGKFSVSVWVKANIVTGSSERPVWSIYANDTNKIWLAYPVPSATNTSQIYSKINSASWTIGGVIVSPLDYGWHSITTVFNGTNWTYYYDGALVISETKGNLANLIGTTNFSIGRSQDSGTRIFDGSIDEIIVFNKSLTSSEVLALYNNQTNYFKQTGEIILSNGIDYNFASGWKGLNLSFNTEKTNSDVNLSYSFGFYNGSDWNYSNFALVNDNEVYTYNFPITTTNISINLTYKSNSTRETPYLNNLVNLTKFSDSNEYYVSHSGDGSNPHSWQGAWQSLAAVQWGTGANQVNAGDILYIDEGMYEEPLNYGANGSGFKLINSTNYEWLMSASNSELATDGWVVVTVGASDGTLDEEVIISGARLFGKTTLGAINSGFNNTIGYTNVYEAVRTLSGTADILWECNTTNLSIKNACTYLSNQTTISAVNSTVGSFFWNDTSNILYVHATGSINVTESTNDYQIVTNGGNSYPMAVDAYDGIVLDGGSNRLLRLSFGYNVGNGLVRHVGGNNLANIIMRNHKQLYAKPNEVTHFWHLNNNRIIFYNMEMGKCWGNQAYSHSEINAGDIYGFVINNTIWDGYESHGEPTRYNPMKEYIISGNIFKQEFYGGQDDVGTLKFLTFHLNNGFINITNNKFIDLDEFFNAPDTSVYISAIFVRSENGTGNNAGSIINIENNNITLTEDVVTGIGIIAYDLKGARVIMGGNTITNFNNSTSSQHKAILLGGDYYFNIGCNNSIIEGNTLINNFVGIGFLADGTNRFLDFNNLTIKDNYINKSNIAGSSSIQFSQNISSLINMINQTYSDTESLYSTAILYRKFYLSSSSNINNTNITVINSTGQVVYSDLINGSIPTQTLISYINNGGTATNYSNYTITATASGYVTNITSFNLTDNANISFTLVVTPVTPVENTGSAGVSATPTYYPDEEEMNAGYAILVGANYKVNFKIGGTVHNLKVNKILNGKVNATVSSEPINFEISVGESKKFDVNGDGSYDLLVLLKEIRASRASFVLTTINEEVVDGKSNGEEAVDEQVVGDEENNLINVEDSHSNSVLAWTALIIVLVVVVLVVVAIGVLRPKRIEKWIVVKWNGN